MKNFSPVIGITPQWDAERELITMRPSYIAALEYAGALPVIIPMTEDQRTLDRYVDMCDALLLSGGHDVQPHLYGEETLPHCGEVLPCRDKLDFYIWERAMAQDKPVFGICRGFQLMNVACGGTLYQDIAIDHGSTIKHRMEEPFNRSVHKVTAVEGTPFADLMGSAPFDVNSVHHQGVKALGKDLEPMAISEDGIVEAFYMPKRRLVWAVQWHPEWFFEDNEESAALIKAFVAAVAEG